MVNILYTSNPNFVPTSLDQVAKFAEQNGKYYTCLADPNSKKGSLKVGAHVITAKGNHIYVLDTSDYEYDFAKKCNITEMISVDYPFSKSENSNPKTMKSNTSIKNISDRLKQMFMPSEAEGVRIATDGNICVATNQGYVAIDANNNLVSYPEELTLGLPIFVISKPKEQLVVGDVIALDRSYAKITRIDGDKITAIGYTGTGKTIHTIKDFLFNQTMVRVVVSLAGNLGGQINPMMLLALSDKDDKKSAMLPLLMMTQNGGALGMNPMMLYAMCGDGELGMKDILLASMCANGMQGFFGAPAVTPTPIEGNQKKPKHRKNAPEKEPKQDPQE